jgi:hypothetical protein
MRQCTASFLFFKILFSRCWPPRLTRCPRLTTPPATPTPPQRSCAAAGRDTTTCPAIQRLVPLAGGEASTVIRTRAIVKARNSSPSQQFCTAAGRGTTTCPKIQWMVPLAGGEPSTVGKARAIVWARNSSPSQ